MRVYELAKSLGISSKEAMELLAKGGFQVQSHMAIVSDEASAFLTQTLTKPAKPAGEKKPESEKKMPIQETAKPVIKPVLPPLEKEEEVQKQAAVEENKPLPTLPLAPMKLGDLADALHQPASELIVALLKSGNVYNKNQIVPEKLVEYLAPLFGYEVVRQKKADAQVVVSVADRVQSQHVTERQPVVVVIGHVDHGKTTLLDFIRKTRVAAKEKGGITQHLGAYQVQTNHGSLIFLDTPGHEAFSLMRKRGVRVADIAIVVVAADDGIMPQTVEAIKQAQAAEIPIVVAINKIDKVDQLRIETIKKQLGQYGLVPEEWGGQTIMVPISAKLGTGVDSLLEVLVLQSEIMELRADATLPAEGHILEAKMQKGFGAVATFLARQGTLHVGDYFVVGDTAGKVTSMTDSHGKRLQAVGPSTPVQLSGFDKLPQAGDYLRVVTSAEHKKNRSQQLDRRVSTFMRTEGKDVLTLMLKMDTESSKEAVVEAINKLAIQEKRPINIIQASVGDIVESDIAHAITTGALIYGFGVKTQQNAATLAQEKGINIHHFDIIYQLLDNIKAYIKSTEEKKVVKEKVGEATVRKVFEIKKVGTVAGFHVKQGKIMRNGTIEVWRDGYKVGSGKIKSLERDKKSMKEVGVGFEGALLLEGFNEWLVDDRIDCIMESTQL